MPPTMSSIALPHGEPPPSYTASLRPPRPTSARDQRSARVVTPTPTGSSDSASETGSEEGIEHDEEYDEDRPTESPGSSRFHRLWSMSEVPRGLAPARAGPSSSQSGGPRDMASSSSTAMTSSRRSAERRIRGSLQRLTTMDDRELCERRPPRSSGSTLPPHQDLGLDPLHHEVDDDALSPSSDEHVNGVTTGFTSGDADTEGFDSELPTLPSNPARSKRQEEDTKRQEEDKEALLFLFLLYPLRLLAIVPEVLAAHTLLRKSITLALAQQDLRRVGMRREPGPLELFMAIFWIMGSGFHALSFTTLLLRRWLLYYAIFPSLIRLVLLQALCWTLVRATLRSFGPNQDLPVWIVISVFTALSDIFTRWVTSNIADMPPPSSRSADASSNGVGVWDRRGRKWEEGYALVIKLVMGDPTHPEDRRSDDLNWSDSANSAALRKQQARQQQLLSALNRELFQAETELHNLQYSGGDWDETLNDAPALQPRARRARAQAEAELTTAIAAIQAAIRKTPSPASLGLGPGKRAYPSPSGGPTANGLKQRTNAGMMPKRTSPGLSGGSTGGSSSSPLLSPPSTPRRTGRMKRRMTGRRVFHWNVALLRNLLPLALLSFATLWILLIDGM